MLNFDYRLGIENSIWIEFVRTLCSKCHGELRNYKVRRLIDTLNQLKREELMIVWMDHNFELINSKNLPIYEFIFYPLILSVPMDSSEWIISWEIIKRPMQIKTPSTSHNSWHCALKFLVCQDKCVINKDLKRQNHCWMRWL